MSAAKHTPGPLADLLRDRRMELGLTLQQVADLTGTSKSYVYELECGISEPGIAKAAALSRVLRLSARSMFDAAIAKATGGAA